MKTVGELLKSVVTCSKLSFVTIQYPLRNQIDEFCITGV
jgi:hypothetical protein